MTTSISHLNSMFNSKEIEADSFADPDFVEKFTKWISVIGEVPITICTDYIDSNTIEIHGILSHEIFLRIHNRLQLTSEGARWEHYYFLAKDYLADNPPTFFFRTHSLDPNPWGEKGQRK